MPPMKLMRRTILALLATALLVRTGVAAEYAAWTWSQQLPSAIATPTARAHRSPAEVDPFFLRGGTRPPSVAQALEFLGPPDGFSPQFMYSKIQGSKAPSKSGGTLRFLLEDGGEVHLWTADFRGVGLAIRYPRQGEAQLLYK